MTVAELRKVLEGAPDEAIVVMSRDAEGNGFSPLYEVERTMYFADSSYSGECFESISEAFECGVETNDPKIKAHLNAICLWPTN